METSGPGFFLVGRFLITNLMSLLVMHGSVDFCFSFCLLWIVFGFHFEFLEAFYVIALRPFFFFFLIQAFFSPVTKTF